MNKAHSEYRVSDLCRALGVPISTVYYKKENNKNDLEIIEAIKEAAEDSYNTYGTRRIRKEVLKKVGSVSLYKIAKLMKLNGVYVRFPRKRHHYPNRGEEAQCAANLLNRKFNPETCNTHWVTDVTYIHSN